MLRGQDWTRFTAKPSVVMETSGGRQFYGNLGRLMVGAATDGDCAGARDVERLEPELREEARQVLAEVAALGERVRAIHTREVAIVEGREAARRQAEAEARSSARAEALKAEKLRAAREIAGAIVEAGESLQELPPEERKALEPFLAAAKTRGRK